MYFTVEHQVVIFQVDERACDLITKIDNTSARVHPRRSPEKSKPAELPGKICPLAFLSMKTRCTPKS
ncbi:hypothetical protein Bhyg_11707 [Pseudolycoriella hygida]|uniref:Uncharacterized protein n=1 Tax=Pseudolycoriella hygida TaxID=35572 RepID=A0A9Q0MWU5_9DIPT|nr:hypothetical protein Bhyg_11707 [Pseudolycoriella hygida]